MSIAQKFKQIIAGISVTAVFASLLVFSPGNASAHEFSDMPASHWAYASVQGLTNLGVFDTNPTFRTDAETNRAEATKIITEAGDLMAGCEQPSTPTFKDYAQPDAWYVKYFECAAAAGVVTGDTGPNGPLGTVRPGFSLLRSEAMALVHRAFNINPTVVKEDPFADDMEGAWYDEILDDLYTAGIVVGDQGKAMLDRKVTRAEFAVLTWKAMNWNEGSTVCDPLTDPNCKDDVCPEDDPTDPDCKPLNCDPNDPNDEDCKPPTTSTGDLEVSLNANTPKGTNLALGATHVELAKFDFDAIEDDVTLTKLAVTRQCVGQNEDFEQIYLYDGTTRLTSGRTLNTDNVAAFPLKFVVPEGTNKTITVVGDVAGVGEAGSGNEHCFTIEAEEDVTHNGVDTTGDFPLVGPTGEPFSIAGQTSFVNEVTIDAGPQPSKVLLGEEGAEIAAFTLEAGSQSSVTLESLALNNAGTFDSEDMENLVLMSGDEVIAEAEGFIGDIATFDLETPMVLNEGQTKTFYVEADLLGGKGGETFILYLEEPADLWILDNDFKQGASIENLFTLALANTVEVEQGDVQVSDNGPSATQIPNDSNDNALLKIGITAASDLTVKDTMVGLIVQDPSGARPTFSAGNTATLDADPILDGACVATDYELNTLDADGNEALFTVGDMLSIGNSFARVVSVDGDTSDGGFCVASSDDLVDLIGTETLTELNPYSFFENFELVVDSDDEEFDGGNLAGPLSIVSGGTLCTGAGTPLEVCTVDKSYATTFSEDYDLTAGETLKAKLVVDIEQEVPPGYQVSAQIQFAENSIKNQESNQFVPQENIIGAGPTVLAGDFMIITEDDLLVSKAANPASHSAVKGSVTEGLGFTLTAGDSGDIEVDRIPVRVYGDSDGNPFAGGASPFPGDTAGNTLVSTVTLFQNGQQVGIAEGIKLVDKGAAGFNPTEGDYYEALFEDLNLEINAGETVSLIAKVQVLNTVVGTKFIALDINPAEIVATDDDNDEVTLGGDLLNGLANKNPLITIGAAGGLTATFEDNPDAGILIMGTDNNFVSQTTFNAVDEAFNVQRFTISFDDDGGDFDSPDLSPAVEAVKVEYKNKQGVTVTDTAPLNGVGVATFQNQTLYVPEDGDAVLKVYANISDQNPEDLSGLKIRLGLQDINDINSFQAFGEGSGNSETFSDAGDVTNGSEAEEFVVRETKPVISNLAPGSDFQNSENQTLYRFKVTNADSNSSLTVARMVFDIEYNNAGAATLGDFKIFDGNNAVDDLDANIIEPGANADITETGGVDLVADFNGQIIVSFDEGITIAGGSSKDFTLKARPTGFLQDETISVGLASGDENVEPTITDISTCTTPEDAALLIFNGSVCSNGNGNSGRIFDTGANEALFNAGTDFAIDDDTGRNFIWSDHSAENPPHEYPVVAAGDVDQGDGTFDYTNGFLLNIINVDSQTVEKS